MRQFSSGSWGVLQGSRMLFSDFADGGPMWTGTGDREIRHLITFAPSFKAPPVVQLSVSLWDADHRTNSRGDLRAENITEKSFQIIFSTWADTRIARLRVDWTAIGPTHDEDDWQVD